MKNADLNPNNEREIVRLKKHPFGIVQLYIGMAFVYVVGIVLVAIGLNSPGLDISTAQKSLAWIILIIVGVFLVLFLLAARYIYWGSEICVTESAVSQIVQLGLFNRKVSRLDMEKVEDVTASQRGVLQTMLNYGTITVETAGEQDNFVFPYCPNPNKMAQDIHNARQIYIERHNFDASRMGNWTNQAALNHVENNVTAQGQPNPTNPQAPTAPAAGPAAPTTPSLTPDPNQPRFDQ